MDIKQLKYFLQICKNNSFSETAKKLYITQQGVSKSIKSLEDEIGLPLFFRNNNKIEVTKYGAYLEKNCAHIIEEFDALKYSIEKMSSDNDKKVKIGYSLGVIGIITALLCDLIFNFENKNPNIKLNIAEYQDFFCEEAVANEEIDLGFAIGPVDETKFNSQTIIQKRMCLMVNDKNKLSQDSEINFENIKNEKIISANKNYKIYHNFIGRCKKAGVEPNMIFTTADLNLITYISSISEVVGIGVDVGAAIHFSDVHQVHFIPFKDLCCTWEVCLITKRGHYISKNEKYFIEYVFSTFQKFKL